MIKGKLRVAEGGIVSFWCPGCKSAHTIGTQGNLGAWQFDGNYEAPTFSPSVLVRSGHYAQHYDGKGCWCDWNRENPKEYPDDPEFSCGICHTFVRNGRIEFLSDCTHEFAGKTVELPVWPS